MELGVELGGAQHLVVLSPIRGSRKELPNLVGHIAPPLSSPEAAGEAYASLFGSGYRFKVRVRAGEGDQVALRAAPLLREWHRRDEQRCELPDSAEARVRFSHPVDGVGCERRLADLSAEGFAFVPEPGDEEVLGPACRSSPYR